MRLGLGIGLKFRLGLKLQVGIKIKIGTPFHTNYWPPLTLVLLLASAYIFSHATKIGLAWIRPNQLSLNQTVVDP